MKKRLTLKRTMLAAGCVLLTVVGVPLARPAIPPNTPADLVVLDANVLTVSERQPKAQAFAVRGGHFVAVGSTRAMTPFIGLNTTVWRLTGKTVTPGFNDAHLHPAPVYTEDAPQYIVPLGPDHVRTMDDLVAALRRK